jgi:hypothetical protein
MPIDISEYAEPKWIRLRDRYTIAGIEDDKAVFMNYENYPRRYRYGYWPQAGYNPNHDSTRVEQINLRQWDYTLKPR